MTEQYAVGRSDPAYAGQAVYSRGTLRAYDTVVVRLSNSLVWRCPAGTILDHYNRHVSARHLDVGPGTGYYLDRCRFPGKPELTLLDANSTVLDYASGRLRRYRPALHAADVLKPVALRPGSFDSIALSYVLHCLPGTIGSKSVVFDNLKPLLSSGGVLFGTTIMPDRVSNPLGRMLMRVYNRKGIFSNQQDDVEGLRRELDRRFPRFDLEVRGAVALFTAWV